MSRHWIWLSISDNRTLRAETSLEGWASVIPSGKAVHQALPQSAALMELLRRLVSTGDAQTVDQATHRQGDAALLRRALEAEIPELFFF